MLTDYKLNIKTSGKMIDVNDKRVISFGRKPIKGGSPPRDIISGIKVKNEVVRRGRSAFFKVVNPAKKALHAIGSEIVIYEARYIVATAGETDLTETIHPICPIEE